MTVSNYNCRAIVTQ